MSDEQWMREALALAREAAADGEVPVGCVVTHGERIVGRGRNRRECGKSALAHAELEAIAEGAKPLAAGGFGSVRYMSRWSRARCAPVPF